MEEERAPVERGAREYQWKGMGMEGHQLLGEGVSDHTRAEANAKELKTAPDVRTQPLSQRIVAHLR